MSEYPAVDVSSNTTNREPTDTVAAVTQRYTCPVCLYDELDSPPEDHLICHRCGTHFGYDDCTSTHAELREMWLAEGWRWQDRARKAAAVTALVEDMLAVSRANYLVNCLPVTPAGSAIYQWEAYEAEVRKRLAAALSGAG